MKRRNFIIQSAIVTGAYPFRKLLSFSNEFESTTDLYTLFRNPPMRYRPFVRWWWNGDKIEREELARELRLLKKAGIGGVEINPVKFPDRTNDLGKRSLQWLSAEWIDTLKFAFTEARSLGMTCDLIVGSGWPFGAEHLEGEERAQIVVVSAKKLEGPLDYDMSIAELFKEADPPISSPFPGRTMELMSLQLAPAIINSLEDVQDLSGNVSSGTIRCIIPQGSYTLYALVKIHGFMQVIQGAPGATGPVLNHYNAAAVKKFLNGMSNAIQKRLGPLSKHIRALFTDSLEVEGSNWCTDMSTEFQKRRGYDVAPYLPFVLFKIGAMGNTISRNDFGSQQSSSFKETIQRVRYDFELTKTELIRERFVTPFLEWCRSNKVKSRMQAYGREYVPLDGSLEVDIPEGETWIRPGLGIDMSDSDYRIGRAYTVVNKFVSSAAHLKNKQFISCEELTNIHQVFNESLELMKVAADMSVLSGMTHAIFHGFNYSPPAADFPGWVIYGSFLSERNPWWPHFRKFVDYKARLSSLLCNATMFTDLAILSPTADLWSIYGAQNDPFPVTTYPQWQTLVWESIHQNGNACDYISDKIVREATVRDGQLVYGERKYRAIFLTQVHSLEPATAHKLLEFVKSGGKVFCIGAYPTKAPGWSHQEVRDAEVTDWLGKMQEHFRDRFVLLNTPGKDHTAWFNIIQKDHELRPYVRIDRPSKYISQVRYRTNNMEALLFINSNMNEGYKINIEVSSEITTGKNTWLWDAETGERFKLTPTSGNKFSLDLGPADLKILVFDKQAKGPIYIPPKKENGSYAAMTAPWSVSGLPVKGTNFHRDLAELKDLKEIPEWSTFCGTIVYRNGFTFDGHYPVEWIDLGKAFGVTELLINGVHAGTKWYGQRVFDIRKFVKPGFNTVEVRMTTTLGNYLKSLTENKAAQFWTNEGRTIQPIQSIGLAGPVKLY